MDEEKWDADAEDADDGDEDDEELGEALLPDRTTLVGNGAARINRSNESILTLCWSWFCCCCAVIKIPANTSYDDDDGPEELTGIINYVSTLQFRSLVLSFCRTLVLNKPHTEYRTGTAGWM